jgi:phenylpyruvate tautomerase PptA (4-oxalocrotonate tautomerase family)
MPLYRCLVAPGLSTQEQRAQIAGAITRIHCAVTGAPPAFVHAFFSEDAKGELPAGRSALVFGGIRSGRTPEQKARLAGEMRAEIAQILGRAGAEVLVATADVPARWVMEGGSVLPEPGEEEEWLARHA